VVEKICLIPVVMAKLLLTVMFMNVYKKIINAEMLPFLLIYSAYYIIFFSCFIVVYFIVFF